MITLLTKLLLAAAIGNLEISAPEKARAAEVYNYIFEVKPPTGFDRSRLDNLSQSDRELVLRWLRAEIQKSPTSSEKENSTYYIVQSSGLGFRLAVLGDEWGLQYIGEEFRKRPRAEWGYKFEMIRNAKLIAMIGDLLYKEEKLEWADDLGLIPTQWAAARGIIETLKHAPQFQADITQWGLDLDDAWDKPGGDVINILREWYRENETKLRAGNFAEVRPGRQPVVAAQSEPATQIPATVTSRSAGGDASLTQQKEVSEERDLSPATSFWGFLGGAIVCLALISALWFWRGALRTNKKRR